jgi:hypothetical protein
MIIPVMESYLGKSCNTYLTHNHAYWDVAPAVIATLDTYNYGTES